MSDSFKLKAYKCRIEGEPWCSLVFAESPRRARYILAERWGSDMDIGPVAAYVDCEAVELPEMEHVTCGEPRIVQWYKSTHDAYLLGLSRIHMCPKCYREYDESGECWCDE